MCFVIQKQMLRKSPIKSYLHFGTPTIHSLFFLLFLFLFTRTLSLSLFSFPVKLEEIFAPSV